MATEEFVILYVEDGLYELESGYPVPLADATRYPTREAAEAHAAADLDFWVTRVVPLSSIPATSVDTADLERRIQSLRNSRDTWQKKLNTLLAFARRTIADPDVQECEIQNAATTLTECASIRARISGYDEAIGLIEAVKGG